MQKRPSNAASAWWTSACRRWAAISYLNMQTRVETGRAYSFYRDSLTGLSIAKIYTRYDSGVTDTAHDLAQHERDNFGKKEDYGTLFTDKEAWDVTYRGARPLPADRFARYKDTTLRDIFYIIRVRLHEPGWMIESKGADVIENRPVEIVDLTDANNRNHHRLFRSDHQAARPAGFLPPRSRHQGQERRGHALYQVPRYRRRPVALRRRARPQRRKDLRDFLERRWRSTTKRSADDLFMLPSTIKLLKPE